MKRELLIMLNKPREGARRVNSKYLRVMFIPIVAAYFMIYCLAYPFGLLMCLFGFGVSLFDRSWMMEMLSMLLIVSLTPFIFWYRWFKFGEYRFML